jgi:hypothetical protein
MANRSCWALPVIAIPAHRSFLPMRRDGDQYAGETRQIGRWTGAFGVPPSAETHEVKFAKPQQ